MADYLIQGDTLTGIADAIRAKTGGTSPIETQNMAAEIGSIETGGGGLDEFFTEVNCVTIRNDATYGRTNGFYVDGAFFNNVKKIEIRFKLNDQGASHFIWASGGPSVQPFIDKLGFAGTGAGSLSVITNETVDDITHYVIEINATSSSRIWIGSWNDAAYSQTAAYYELKMWDAENNLIVDMQPSVNTVTGRASFLNKISGIFALSMSGFIAGEVMS